MSQPGTHSGLSNMSNQLRSRVHSDRNRPRDSTDDTPWSPWSPSPGHRLEHRILPRSFELLSGDAWPWGVGFDRAARGEGRLAGSPISWIGSTSAHVGSISKQNRLVKKIRNLLYSSSLLHTVANSDLPHPRASSASVGVLVQLCKQSAHCAEVFLLPGRTAGSATHGHSV